MLHNHKMKISTVSNKTNLSLQGLQVGTNKGKANFPLLTSGSCHVPVQILLNLHNSLYHTQTHPIILGPCIFTKNTWPELVLKYFSCTEQNSVAQAYFSSKISDLYQHCCKAEQVTIYSSRIYLHVSLVWGNTFQ